MERRAGDYNTWYLQGDSTREEEDLKGEEGPEYRMPGLGVQVWDHLWSKSSFTRWDISALY